MGAIKSAVVVIPIFLASYLVFYDQMLQVVVLRQLELTVVDAFAVSAVGVVAHGDASRKF